MTFEQQLLTIGPAGFTNPLQRLVKSHHFDIDTNHHLLFPFKRPIPAACPQSLKLMHPILVHPPYIFLFHHWDHLSFGKKKPKNDHRNSVLLLKQANYLLRYAWSLLL